MPGARYDGTETTGFASPSQDHGEAPINLAEALELRSPGRYCVRVTGNGLAKKGILDGDYLVVEADARPTAGALAVAFLDGCALLGELEAGRGGWSLLCGGRRHQISEDAGIWAIAVALVRLDLARDRITALPLIDNHADLVARP